MVVGDWPRNVAKVERNELRARESNLTGQLTLEPVRHT